MTVPLEQSVAFVLDLAKQPDGFLAQSSEVIDELRRSGLVSTQNVGDGFVIVKAIVRPAKQRRAKGQWVWPEERVTT
jgi:hypothetical protein